MRGCHSIDTVIGGVGKGNAKQCMPWHRLPTCRCGTLATRSEARANAIADEKPATMVMISRFSPNSVKASSITPFSWPRRETRMCRASA
ncbi:hypothetical protein D3C78_1382190 [compost metagenome]